MSGLPHVARSMAAVLLLIFPFALDAQTLPSATQLELAPGTDQAFGYEATTTASPSHKPIGERTTRYLRGTLNTG